LGATLSHGNPIDQMMTMTHVGQWYREGEWVAPALHDHCHREAV